MPNKRKRTSKGAGTGSTGIGFALVETPIIEGLGEALGRIEIGGKLSDIIKLLPFGETIGKLFKKADPDKDTDEQIRQDNKRVVKVRDANKVIDDELTGFFGKLQEFGDSLSKSGLTKPPNVGDKATLVRRIKQRIRDKALQQANPRAFKEKNVYTRKP